MNIAVRYQSKGGNTKAAAEIIAKAVGVEAEPISAPVDGVVDVLFIGGGVYAWSLSGELKKFIKSLSSDKVKLVVAFSTSAGTDGAAKIIKFANKCGLKTHANTLPLTKFKSGLVTAQQEKQVTNFALDSIKQ